MFYAFQAWSDINYKYLLICRTACILFAFYAHLETAYQPLLERLESGEYEPEDEAALREALSTLRR